MQIITTDQEPVSLTTYAKNGMFWVATAGVAYGCVLMISEIIEKIGQQMLPENGLNRLSKALGHENDKH